MSIIVEWLGFLCTWEIVGDGLFWGLWACSWNIGSEDVQGGFLLLEAHQPHYVPPDWLVKAVDNSWVSFVCTCMPSLRLGCVTPRTWRSWRGFCSLSSLWLLIRASLLWKQALLKLETIIMRAKAKVSSRILVVIHWCQMRESSSRYVSFYRYVSCRTNPFDLA